MKHYTLLLNLKVKYSSYAIASHPQKAVMLAYTAGILSDPYAAIALKITTRTTKTGTPKRRYRFIIDSLKVKVGSGGGNRTPTNGFGDRRTAIILLRNRLLFGTNQLS